MRLKKYSDRWDRIRAIVFALKGSTDVEISDRLGYSTTWVKKWVRRYKDFGLDGLCDQARPGAPSKLTEDQIMKLYEKVLTGPRAEELLSRYRISDLKEIISRDWKIDYSISGLHSVMKRMKLSHVTPRPQHPKNDPLVMEEWKKKPKSLSKNKSQARAGRKLNSGTRMKRDLAKKES